MKPFLLSRDNVELPNIVYGTAWKKDQTEKLVLEALKAGFQGIDTACQPRHYNEIGVGKGLSLFFEKNNKRESLFIQTKFTPVDGQDLDSIPYNPNDSIEKQLETSLEISLKNLGVKYIDSYVLHSPLKSLDLTVKAFEKMSEFKKSGLIKQLGISNCYNLEFLKELIAKTNIIPTVIQNRFYQETNYDYDLRKFCVENDIIYQSFWTLSANPDVLQSDVISKLSMKYKKSLAQIFFKFLNQNNVIPLCGTTKNQHMNDCMELDTFLLEEEDIKKINSLKKFF